MSATLERKISWDKSEIVKNEIKYMQDRESEDLEGLSTDEIETMAWDDQDLIDNAWDYIIEYLDELLKEFNTEKKDYQVNINNFGWRNLSGEKTLNHDVNGEEFLKGILPDAECTFNITFKKDVIEIVNYHHDSPTGETYYIKLK